MSTSTRRVSLNQVSSSVQVSDVHLSPDGSKVLYVVQPICKKDQNSSIPSSIWLAETNRTNSERQLTSLAEKASCPSFQPDGRCMIYLSDSYQPGGPLQLHSLNLLENSKPILLLRQISNPVTLFSVSPNGEHIAFTSADEGSGEVDTSGRSERLQIYTFASSQVITVSPADDLDHVNGFVWAPDSRELLFYTWPANSSEYRESSMPNNQKTIGVYHVCVENMSPPRCLGHLNQTPGPWERQSFVWTTPNEIVNISKFEPSYRSMDGMATQWYPLDKFDSPIRGDGCKNNPNSIIDLHHNGMIAILVECGTSTTIEIWQEAKHVKTLLELKDDAISTASGSWDLKWLHDETFKIATVRSSGINCQAENIWISSYDSNGNLIFDKPLTKHNKDLESLEIRGSILEWVNNGIELQGTVTYPPSYKFSSAPFPTILLIHSGPYSRAVPDYKLDKFRLQLFLASYGYLVLSPNYRGSSGRGSAFARVSGSQLITESWSDCDSMIEHAMSLGLADPSRLALAGHSSGGYLTALGASITKDKYKACITFSGPSDLTNLTGTSQTPEFQFSMSGLAPWSPEPADLLQNVGGRTVHPSPVRNLEGVETAFLILHGEEDPQVPVSQATILWRGLKRLSKLPERHAMVIYRREGHAFAEKGHLEDGLSRTLDHLGRYLA